MPIFTREIVFFVNYTCKLRPGQSNCVILKYGIVIQVQKTEHFQFLGQDDPKFLLIKLASLVLHSEYLDTACQPTISNDFSVNVYLVEEPEGHIKIAADPHGTIQLAIDHFQFAQIIQIQKIVNALLEKVKTDRIFFQKRYSQPPVQAKVDVYVGIERVSRDG